MAYLLGHAAPGGSIYKLYLAAGAIRNDDIGSRGGDAFGLFIGDFLG